jgi:hypothetical protein
MVIERTFEGWQASVRARGFARYFGAAFLGLWLCGWAAGEVFVVVFLVGIAWQGLTGQPIHPGLPTIEDSTAPLAVAGLLLLWLTLWTLGGVAALWSFLRMLWAEDRLVVRSDALVVVRRAGPVSRSRQIPRETIRRLYRTSGRGLVGKLMASTTAGSILITDCATPEELDQLETELTRELGLKAVTSATLPAGWEEIALPEGGTALVESPATRRRYARILSAITTGLLLSTVGIAGGGHPLLAAVPGVFAGLFCWGAVRLGYGRHEWRWSAKRLRLDWRFRGQVRTVFEGDSLELGVSSDSDGDRWYELKAFATPTPGPGPAPKSRKHKAIARSMGDPLEPRALGEWLALRCGIALQDNTDTSARAAQTEQLRKQLAASGKLGAWIANLLPPPRGTK